MSIVPMSGAGVRSTKASARWARAGSGKRGGVRVIYFTRLLSGEIWPLVIYAKNVRGNIPAHILKAIREIIDND